MDAFAVERGGFVLDLNVDTPGSTGLAIFRLFRSESEENHPENNHPSCPTMSRTVTFPLLGAEDGETYSIQVSERQLQEFHGVIPIPEEGPIMLEAPMTEDLFFFVFPTIRWDRVIVQAIQSTEFAEKLGLHDCHVRLWGLLRYLYGAKRVENMSDFPIFLETFDELAQIDLKVFEKSEDQDPTRAFLEAVLTHNDMEFREGSWAPTPRITPQAVAQAHWEGRLMQAFRHEVDLIRENHPFSSTACYHSRRKEFCFLRRFWSLFYRSLNTEGRELPFAWDHLVTPGFTLAPVLDVSDLYTLVRILYVMPCVAYQVTSPHDEWRMENFKHESMKIRYFNNSYDHSTPLFFYLYFLLHLLDDETIDGEVKGWAEEELDGHKSAAAQEGSILLTMNREDLQDKYLRLLFDTYQEEYLEENREEFPEELPEEFPEEYLEEYLKENTLQ